MPTPRKIRCRIERVVDHGDHVYSVDLAPEQPAPKFYPGQFLHLALDDYDPSGFWPESRVFSIASSPGNRSRIRICYSVKGRYTSRMEKELREGGAVWIKLPYGEFMIDTAATVVLFAGGTGISAFTAFIEGLSSSHNRSVCLVYGARSPALWLFSDLIQRQVRCVPAFRAFLLAESAGTDANPVAESETDGRLRYSTGRTSVDVVWPHLQDPLTWIYYLSGPPAMLSTLSKSMRERGVTPDRVRTDAWE